MNAKGEVDLDKLGRLSGVECSGRGTATRGIVTKPTWGLLFLLVVVSGAAFGQGKAGQSPEDLGILAVDLGIPEGCLTKADVWPQGLGNDGGGVSTVSIAAAVYGCEVTSTRPRRTTGAQPILWDGSAWQAVGLPAGKSEGFANDVSESGTVAGGTVGDGAATAFAQRHGQGVEVLPKDSFYHADAYDISNDGLYIVGGLDQQDRTLGEGHAALWTWDESGEEWQLQILGPGRAGKVTDDGELILGSQKLASGSRMVLWQPGSEPIDLQLAEGYRVNSMDYDGRILVGYRLASCISKRPKVECEYEVPVYWTRDDVSEAWVPTDLEALDGVDSEANAVADIYGTGFVIVGYGFTRADAVLRAVAWIPEADGTYGAPIRLAPLGGDPKASAFAKDINSQGVVLGGSEILVQKRRYYDRAALWILP